MQESVHTKTKRIARNTALLYVRSLISLFISLYTSRLILKGLGVNDYGIYGVVGGFVSMFSIVAGSLRGTISRFINFAMGKGDKEELANTFALSLSIMLLISLIVILLTETFGLWFLNNRLNIPPDRMKAAFWCFQFSVLSSVSNFLVIPFAGPIIAHEKMDVVAYIDVSEVVLKFFIALLITFSAGKTDKLVLYAALILAITLTKQMISRIYSMKNFEECRIRWYWNKKKFVEMFSYAGWSFLGTTSSAFAGQGVNMIVNVVFGPAVNAARSLSGTVNNSVQIFVNNFTLAIWPQVTQSYAAGDHQFTKNLLFRGAKFTYYIMWIVALPLLMETEFVVRLWLGEYPDHTINFIRLALIANTFNVLQSVLGMGIKATGKIKWLQLSSSILGFAYFGVVYIMLHNGFVPEWTYICSLFVVVIQLIIMLVLCRRQLGMTLRDFITKVLSPVSLVTVVSAIIPCIFRVFMPMGFCRFLIVLIVSLASSGLCILYIGCSPEERKMLISLVINKIKKTP